MNDTTAVSLSFSGECTQWGKATGFDPGHLRLVRARAGAPPVRVLRRERLVDAFVQAKVFTSKTVARQGIVEVSAQVAEIFECAFFVAHRGPGNIRKPPPTEYYTLDFAIEVARRLGYTT